MLVAVLFLCLKYALTMPVFKGYASFGFNYASEKYENMFCRINMPKNHASTTKESLDGKIDSTSLLNTSEIRPPFYVKIFIIKPPLQHDLLQTKFSRPDFGENVREGGKIFRGGAIMISSSRQRVKIKKIPYFYYFCIVTYVCILYFFIKLV